MEELRKYQSQQIVSVANSRQAFHPISPPKYVGHGAHNPSDAQQYSHFVPKPRSLAAAPNPNFQDFATFYPPAYYGPADFPADFRAPAPDLGLAARDEDLRGFYNPEFFEAQEKVFRHQEDVQAPPRLVPNTSVAAALDVRQTMPRQPSGVSRMCSLPSFSLKPLLLKTATPHVRPNFPQPDTPRRPTPSVVVTAFRRHHSGGDAETGRSFLPRSTTDTLASRRVWPRGLEEAAEKRVDRVDRGTGWDSESVRGYPFRKPARATGRRRRLMADELSLADWSTIAASTSELSEGSVLAAAALPGRSRLKRRLRRDGLRQYIAAASNRFAMRRAAAAEMAVVPWEAAGVGASLSPVASTSMLTCNGEFKRQFPFVYQGLCKGMIDIRRLMAHEIVIPVKEEICIKRAILRSRKAVTNAVSDRLWRTLQGRFPDPGVAPKLIRKMAEYFYDQIEYGIQDAEDERPFLQWLFRFDVENAIDLRQQITLGAGKNSVLANIEGSAHVNRKKGELFNLVGPDVIHLNLECVIRALFLNGGPLAEINRDSMFIDRVRGGDNQFASSFFY